MKRDKSIIILAMGVFDGVHQGHRFILKKVCEKAKKYKGKSIVYTFHPHPIRVLAPQACPENYMINTIKQRTQLLKNLGIDKIIVEKFTKNFSKLTPEQFIKKIILNKIKPSEIFVGYNFTFGVKRSGTAKDLQKLCKPHHIHVNIVSPFQINKTITSSTKVRQLISQGEMPVAQKFLTRPYFIEGTVVKGKGIGGKVLGIPTANLKSDNEILLPCGVYVTKTQVGSQAYPSVTNVGHNPTFQKPGKEPIVTIETHILKFRQNIVGKKIRLYFSKKLRNEKKFSSPQELIKQIHEDIKQAKKYS